MSSALFRVVLVAFAWIAVATAVAAQSSGQTAAAVEALQRQILADPRLADQVHALSDDPRVREILADPSVAGALERGDFGALLANPRVRELADDPAMQGVVREVVPSP